VGGYIGGAGDECAIVGEEVPDIADLRQEEDNPAES
jgi:hypothetical protein